MPLVVVTPFAAQVPCATLGLSVFVPLVVLMARLEFGPRVQMTQTVMGRDPHW
jgi:hypothetical protein